MNEGCLSGHYWNGTSQCSLCGERLRCNCGAYVREDNLENHMNTCKFLARLDSASAKPETANTDIKQADNSEAGA